MTRGEAQDQRKTVSFSPEEVAGYNTMTYEEA
jgi:hypothetical protein